MQIETALGNEYAYLYDDSWDGLLSAVFRAFETKEWPQSVQPEENAQLAFGQRAVHITTDPEKARRVEQGIVRRMGSPAHQKVWTAFLSGDTGKSTVIYRYICTGMSKGRGIYNALAHDDVAAIENLNCHTGREAHLLQGFTRFSLMENGIYYAKISPKNHAVPLLMPFFADRYNDQPFLLYDDVHHTAGVYDLKEWYMVETDNLTLPALSEEELPMRRLWKLFYNTIAIAHRTNPRCRRGHMPMRYWSNLTEMTTR